MARLAQLPDIIEHNHMIQCPPWPHTCASNHVVDEGSNARRVISDVLTMAKLDYGTTGTSRTLEKRLVNAIDAASRTKD